jgi:hypothetical protein
MPEILTESFCERCGTRYTFESAAPRTTRLKGLKVVSRGLRNFVMSDDTSMDEAMAAARSETDREVTSRQLDAFHKTFNFCMSCRQYTCGNCWNEADGRCLSCAPHLGHEILPAPFPDLDTGSSIVLGENGHDGEAVNGHDPFAAAEAMTWPTSDLMREDEPAIAAPATEEPEPIDLAGRLATIEASAEGIRPAPASPEAPSEEPEPVSPEVAADAPVVGSAAPAPAAHAAAADAPAARPQDGDVDGRIAAAAAQTAQLLQRFRPGQSLDDALEAYEREQAALTTAADRAPEPVGDATPPEPEVESAQPTPDAPEPEPIAAAAQHAGSEVAPEPAAEPRIDVVPQPTWRIVAPDTTTADGVPAPPFGAPGPVSEPSVPGAEPQWPARPEWPSQRPVEGGLPFLGRPVAAQGGIDALWAESAREVTTAPAVGGAPKATGGVQPCVSCGLSLSASARFCRRCGTRQG